MTTILIKAVEYPDEKVLELDDLTQEGLREAKSQAEDFIKEIEWLIK